MIKQWDDVYQTYIQDLYFKNYSSEDELNARLILTRYLRKYNKEYYCPSDETQKLMNIIGSKSPIVLISKEVETVKEVRQIKIKNKLTDVVINRYFSKHIKSNRYNLEYTLFEPTVDFTRLGIFGRDPIKFNTANILGVGRLSEQQPIIGTWWWEDTNELDNFYSNGHCRLMDPVINSNLAGNITESNIYSNNIIFTYDIIFTCDIVVPFCVR